MGTAFDSPTIVVSADLLMTRRLVLRPLRKRDIDTLHALLADPSVRRQLGLLRRATWREAAAIVARSLALRSEGKGGLWAALGSLRSPHLIGLAGLWDFREHAQSPEELVVAVADAPNGVIAAEAAQAVLDHARYVLQRTGLNASADARLLLQLGFAACPAPAGSRRGFRIEFAQVRDRSPVQPGDPALAAANEPAPLPRAAGW